MGMPVIKGSNTTQCQALTDILESIALEEAGIAHIINAEGEKLQRVIGECNLSVDEILDVNTSVESMIDKVTSLEIVLKSKLDTVKSILLCCNKCDHHSPKPCCD